MLNAKFIIEIEVKDIQPDKDYTSEELVDLIGATLVTHGIKNYDQSKRFKTYCVLKRDVQVTETRRIKHF